MIVIIVMILVDMVMEDILTTAVDITPHHIPSIRVRLNSR
jgi:hypothetical protein